MSRCGAQHRRSKKRGLISRRSPAHASRMNTSSSAMAVARSTVARLLSPSEKRRHHAALHLLGQGQDRPAHQAAASSQALRAFPHRSNRSQTRPSTRSRPQCHTRCLGPFQPRRRRPARRASRTCAPAARLGLSGAREGWATTMTTTTTMMTMGTGLHSDRVPFHSIRPSGSQCSRPGAGCGRESFRPR